MSRTETQTDETPIILKGGFVAFRPEALLEIDVQAWQFDEATKRKRAQEFAEADELNKRLLAAAVPAKLLEEIRALDAALAADEQAARFALDELEEAEGSPPQTAAKVIAWRARQRTLEDTVAAHQESAQQTQTRLDAAINQARKLLSDARIAQQREAEARIAEIKTEAERLSAPLRERLQMLGRIGEALERHADKVITSPANEWLG